jgi:RimJ/RimL family protein N-acetyltransferase
VTTIVYELDTSRMHVARSLFDTAWFDEAYIDSVFESRQPGRLFVDNPEQPTAAILFRTFGFYVAGNAGSTALRRFIRDAPPEPGVFQSLYGYVPIGTAWTQALLDDHGNALEVIPRHGLKWHPTDDALAVVEGWQSRLPDGATMVEIDLALARRIDREMNQFIESFWLSHEAYAEGGFGYCLMFGDTIASIAYTVSVSSREANIDVETVERFRRQGLSTLTSCAYIDYCRSLGLIATWDSDGNNPNSLATARKLGFQEYPPFAQLSSPRGTSLLGAEGLWEWDGGTQWSYAG